MHDSIIEAILAIREEIGLERFAVGDTVMCNLYLTDDIQFECQIYSINRTAGNRKVYLVNCPISIGYIYQELQIKVERGVVLNPNLYYRWTEEATLNLIKVL